MTKDELLAILRPLNANDADDFEATHYDADKALLAFIGDPEITAAYEAVGRWYA